MEQAIGAQSQNGIPNIDSAASLPVNVKALTTIAGTPICATKRTNSRP